MSNRIVPFPGSYDEREERTVMVPLARLVLRATAGPLRAQAFVFDGSKPFIIGRGQGNAVTIPSQAVSRVHARIEYANGTYVLIPEKTLNGTRVNGQLVQEATQLTDKDKIAIDDSAFVVSCNADGLDLDFDDLAPPPAAPQHPPGPRVSVTAMSAPAPHYSQHEMPASYPSNPNLQYPQARPSYQQLPYDGYPPAPYPQQPPPAAKPRILLWSLAAIGVLAVISGVVVATVKLMGPQTVVTAPAPVVAQVPAPAPAPVVVAAPKPEPAPAPKPEPAPVPVAATKPKLVLETTRIEAGTRGTVVDVSRVGSTISQSIGHVRLYSAAFDAAQTKLTNLQKKYGKSEEYADFIAEAKQDYVTAARRREVKPIEASAGTVTKILIKPGDELRLKQAIAEVASAHVIAAAETIGDAKKCTVEVGTKKLKGTVIAPDTIALDQLPKDIAAGELDAKIHCE